MSRNYEDEFGRPEERQSRRNGGVQRENMYQSRYQGPRKSVSGAENTGTGNSANGTGVHGVGGARQSMARSRNQEPVRQAAMAGAAGHSSRGLDVMDFAGRSGDSTGRMSSRAMRQSAAGIPGGSGLPPQDEEKIRSARRIRRIIIMVVAECFALLMIFGYAAVAKRWNIIQRPDFEEAKVKNNDLSMETVEKMKGYWTIAIFGVDDRGKVIGKGTNADVNMICNINMDTGEIKLVSVFRDTYLNVNENGSFNKINQAYFQGGPEQAVAALNRNLDLDITSYATFNWKAVAQAIDILGGVDIELSKAEFYYINSFITETVKATGIGSQHLKKAGMNHLDGVQAVAYGRLRLMDTDYARTERQRKVIMQAFEKAKKADIGVLNNIVETVFPNVASNVTPKDVIYMAMNINKYYLSETTGFPQARGDANMGKKGAVVVPQTLETNVTQLHKFLFGDEDYTPTSAVKKLSASISAETGMYKEGKYVDHVSTEGGVIQPPKKAVAPTKETKKETEENDDDEEDKKKKLKETDKYGNRIWETNEDGDVVKRETDENGNTVKETTKSKGTSAAETDENGNRIETSENESSTEESQPGSTKESPENRPGGSTETTGIPRPGTNTSREDATILHPGDYVTPGDNNGPGTVNESATSAISPGDMMESTTAVQQYPGQNTVTETPAALPETSSSAATLLEPGNGPGGETQAPTVVAPGQP